MERVKNVGTLEGELASWSIHLAVSCSERTVEGYTSGVRKFARYQSAHGRATEVSAITSDDIDAFLVHVREHSRPWTAVTLYRDLDQFFKWQVAIGELEVSPLTQVRKPKLTEEPVPVVPLPDLQKLLGACSGRGFEDRRDAALIRVFVDSGARLGEVAGLRLQDVVIERHRTELCVTGKSGTRWVSIGRATVKALDLYNRSRSGHKDSDLLDWLWLGPKGRLTDSGIAQMLRRRSNEAGIPKIHPHQLRHTFAHMMKSEGCSDDDLRRLGGWKSPQMLVRYGASAAHDRARETHRRLSPGDRL